MAQKFLLLVKTGIFYEFSKWQKTHYRAEEFAEREWVECSL